MAFIEILQYQDNTTQIQMYAGDKQQLVELPLEVVTNMNELCVVRVCV